MIEPTIIQSPDMARTSGEISKLAGLFFWGAIGGSIVLIGIILEVVWEKHWYKNISDFRMSEKIRTWGARILIFGILWEVVAAGTFAVKEECFRLSSDPVKKPIKSLSAIVKFRASGDFAARWNAAAGERVFLSFSKSNSVSGTIPEISLYADKSDVVILNVFPISEHTNECDVVIQLTLSDLIIKSLSNTLEISHPAEVFKGVKSFVLSMPQPGTSVKILSGEVLVAVNQSFGWRFVIPEQIQRHGIISGQITTNAANKIEWKVLPMHLVDISGKDVGEYEGK